MARPRRRSLQRAAAARRDTRDFDAERRFDVVDDVRPRTIRACECGAILRGVKKPARLQAVRHGLHAGDADGLLHGLARKAPAPPIGPTAASATVRGARSSAGPPSKPQSMKILLICHSFNSLTQRLHVELRERGHRVSVELDVNDANTREAVDLFEPDLVIAPFLKRAISPDVLACALCLVVHPGPRGDRGPSALDWAILEGRRRWGVTLIEATSELDGGPIWAWREFDVRAATKSSLYRREATRAAIACVEQAIAMIGRGERPESDPAAPKPLRGSCRREDRRVDFATDSVVAVLRKIRSADGAPGAPAILFGRDTLVFDAHEAYGLAGSPGAALARSGPAVAVAARDGVVWIGHARDPARRGQAARERGVRRRGRGSAGAGWLSKDSQRTGGRRRLSALPPSITAPWRRTIAAP